MELMSNLFEYLNDCQFFHNCTVHQFVLSLFANIGSFSHGHCCLFPLRAPMKIVILPYVNIHHIQFQIFTHSLLCILIQWLNVPFTMQIKWQFESIQWMLSLHSIIHIHYYYMTMMCRDIGKQYRYGIKIGIWIAATSNQQPTAAPAVAEIVVMVVK